MKHFEYIEKNLTGQTTKEEFGLFKQKTASDKDFAKEVAFYVYAKKNIEGYSIQDIDISQKETKIVYLQKTKILVGICVAASVMLLIGFFIFNNAKDKPPGSLMGKPSSKDSMHVRLSSPVKKK
jgi:hypothetical protein